MKKGPKPRQPKNPQEERRKPANSWKNRVQAKKPLSQSPKRKNQPWVKNHGTAGPNQRPSWKQRDQQDQAKEPQPNGAKGPKKDTKDMPEKEEHHQWTHYPLEQMRQRLETDTGILNKMHPAKPPHLEEPHST
ncbi:hypothetical protein NDU88_008039 [Pleurodeles waltl]|uniref:Uncharacterized protein n=1 Tax=Pleurodeles waltl TaxID=8319 RepID=A0AAV7RWH9_PLEWA|nr:hypothetical protein NDU88_008039 [Pleurodeles waltl]